MPADRVRAWMRSVFLVNKGMKFLSLFVAVLVWYGIRGAISFEAVLEDIPVRILCDEGWAVCEGAGQTVDVRFRGSRGDIRNMTPDQVLVTIDVRGESRPGQQVILLTPRHVKAPTGARPIHFRPEQVIFTLDREAKKEIPVTTELQGQLPDGFDIERVVCTPESVTVYAPSARLETLETIRTTPVDLDGRIQSFRLRRPLVPVGAMRLEPDRVQVEVVIREHAFVREYEKVPVHVFLRPGQSAPPLSPNEVTVELQGQPDILNGLDSESVRAYVLAPEPAIGVGRNVSVRVHVPAGIRVVRVTPDVVQLNPVSP